MRNEITRIFLLMLATLLTACGNGHSADEAAITGLLMKSFDRPDAPLVVGPIAVQGDAAIADWTQGALGGRALLRSRNAEWSVVLCAGDGIKSAQALRLAGLPDEQAGQLAEQLARKERELSAEHLATLATFKGVVRMGPVAGGSATTDHSSPHHSSVAHAAMDHASTGPAPPTGAAGTTKLQTKHGIGVLDATIPAPPAGAGTAAGYFIIENAGDAAVRLLSVQTPVASSVSLHFTSSEDGISRMRHLADGVTIEAGGRIEFASGGRHLMLEGLQRVLLDGEQIPITLTFDSAATQTVNFAVRKRSP